MPTPRTRRSIRTSRHPGSTKKDARPASPSLNNILDFIAKIANEHDTPQQQLLITEYAEKVAASELLSLPVDENGHVILSKTTGFEEEILEKTALSLASFINTVLKNKKHIKDIRAKADHNRLISPIIPLEYPKKNYKTKYLLKKKVIR